jgi:aryl-alcohol dehydrogenase-like predicted oxidoreductase
MQYRPLGRTGLLVSEICFGTMTFGDNDGLWANIGTLGVDDAVEQLRMSFDAGLNFIDTANIYHQGRTEEIIGEALRKAGVQRDSYILATKVRGRMSADPNGVGLTRHHILNEIDNSLRRLGHDHVDLYQIHGFDPATPFDETLRALDDVVRSGKVRHIGLCNLAAWQIMKCLAISEMSGWAASNRYSRTTPWRAATSRERSFPLRKIRGWQYCPGARWPADSFPASSLATAKALRGRVGRTSTSLPSITSGPSTASTRCARSQQHTAVPSRGWHSPGNSRAHS